MSGLGGGKISCVDVHVERTYIVHSCGFFGGLSLFCLMYSARMYFSLSDCAKQLK